MNNESIREVVDRIDRNTSEESNRYKSMVRALCNIIESEYPESDERYQFAMNCLTDVGDK